MEKFLKYFFLVVFVYFTITLIFNIFESKPFKFENFNSTQEVKAYLDEHYLGKDISMLLKDLTLVGVEYIQRPTKISKKEMGIKLDGDYEKVYVGRYSNNFLSLHPLTSYYFSFYIDSDDKVIGIFVKQKSSIEFP